MGLERLPDLLLHAGLSGLRDVSLDLGLDVHGGEIEVVLLLARLGGGGGGGENHDHQKCEGAEQHRIPRR
jgi:hypothetical protein